LIFHAIRLAAEICYANWVAVQRGFSGNPISQWSDMYPVPVQAMRAFEQLGLVLELTDDGQYRVVEP
jgi:hypothetical protein